MAQIITIGKRRWLAGMHWTSYEETPGKEELRQDAQRTQGMGQGRNSIAPAWIALRTNDEAIQAGFAEAIGVKSPKHIASLAAMLADSKVQPWNGIFQIADDLWWYIAVRDGHAILPDGDVIGTKAEIDAARQRHASFTDWNVVEGDLGLLEAMLNAVVHKPTPVRSTVSNHLPMMWMVVGSVVLVGLAIGGWQWQVHTAETERLRAQLLEKSVRKKRRNQHPRWKKCWRPHRDHRIGYRVVSKQFIHCRCRIRVGSSIRLNVITPLPLRIGDEATARRWPTVLKVLCGLMIMRSISRLHLRLALKYIVNS